MRLELRLRPAAVVDLENVWLTGLKLWSPQQCEQYVDDLFRFMSSLSDFPDRYRVRKEIRDEIRIAPFRSHIIIYRVTPPILDVIRVRHGHEDWAGEFESE